MIKRITILRWLLTGAILLFSMEVNAQVVFQSLQWHNRVLVLSASESSSQIDEQIVLLAPFTAEIEARELVVLRLRSQALEQVPDLSPFPFETRILNKRNERRYLRSLFAGGDDFNDELRLTLVGLDGEVKQVWDGVVEPLEIFKSIDAMLVRQKALERTLEAK